jgi:hypothetical protein
MPLRNALTSIALAAAALASHATAARADIMAACPAEIRQFCPDVTRGRGRISACLASHRDALGPACLPEVAAVAQSPLVPRYARAALSPGFRAALPQACAAPAASFCPGVPPGDGRIFACLYARSDRIGAGCTSAAKAALGD